VGAELVGVRLEEAACYAEASNRGAEYATGELILFLNDDIRPLEPGWLRELVSTMMDGGAAIAGATLVAPRRAEVASDGTLWVLEQRGIGVHLVDGEPVPVRREQGEDVLGGGFGTDVGAVAVSGACMLIAGSTFATIGAFDSGYQYGLEDVDL